MLSPMPSLAAALLTLATLASATNTIRVCNNYADFVHLSWDCSGGYLPPDILLLHGQCRAEQFPAGWSGAVYAGLVNNSLATGDWRTHDTKVEFTVDGEYGFDWFDVDLEWGQSVPVMIYAGSITGGCKVDKLPHCPPSMATREPGKGPKSPIVQCARQVKGQAEAYFREGCPNLYVNSNDDKQGTKAATEHPDLIEVVIGTL